jgi:hypothetical protein
MYAIQVPNSTSLTITDGTNSRTYSTSLSTSTWTHLVFEKTASGDNAAVYVNDTQLSSSGSTGTGAPNTASQSGSLYVGRDASGGYVNGSIGMVRVYSQALSQNQVKQNCKAMQSRYSSSSICN